MNIEKIQSKFSSLHEKIDNIKYEFEEQLGELKKVSKEAEEVSRALEVLCSEITGKTVPTPVA